MVIVLTLGVRNCRFESYYPNNRWMAEWLKALILKINIKYTFYHRFESYFIYKCLDSSEVER